jgi:ribonucrease Y
MFWIDFFIFLVSSFVISFSVLFAIYKYVQISVINEAKSEANEIIKDATDSFNEDEKERLERSQEIELELWSKVEEAHLNIEEKCTDLDDQIQSRKKLYEEKDKLGRQALMQNETELRNLSMSLNDVKIQLETIQKTLLDSQLNYQSELVAKTQLKAEDVVDQIKQKLINDVQADVEKMIEATETESKEFAEAKAKRILSLCIDRFSKEMSTERNIQSTYFPDERIRGLFCARLEENITVIQEMTGCDVLIDKNPEPERMFNIQVVGYDPVRRELTRRIFEKIFRDTEKSLKQTDPVYIRRVSETLKAELLKQIKKDGEALAKELGFQDMHPEIKQVMGSLRFRYSYTQNQYFHCGEVGWFAGLLAAELGVDIKKSRRSGLLHDLGKALDHQFDGSHAVIGADFIALRGEDAEVIHAVRAHHYDVQPDAEMDFLVIAADAISGGRPGARRSTMETYTQKVTGLQEISKRFTGVTDVFILNGGRECRVHVNSKQVDDLQALKIAEQIAKTIEEEMQYPGQIKVVVVRETVVSESRHVEQRGYHKDRNQRN